MTQQVNIQSSTLKFVKLFYLVGVLLLGTMYNYTDLLVTKILKTASAEPLQIYQPCC